jgi:hypothetical protein
MNYFVVLPEGEGLLAMTKDTVTKIRFSSVRPEPFGKLRTGLSKGAFMVRQAHQERDCTPDSCENDIFIHCGADVNKHDRL